MEANRNYKNGKNRLLTFFCYLNNVEAGGYTAFPYSGPNSVPINENNPDAETCQGLKITPKMGDCILWYNLLPEFQMQGKVDL